MSDVVYSRLLEADRKDRERFAKEQRKKRDAELNKMAERLIGEQERYEEELRLEEEERLRAEQEARAQIRERIQVEGWRQQEADLLLLQERLEPIREKLLIQWREHNALNGRPDATEHEFNTRVWPVLLPRVTAELEEGVLEERRQQLRAERRGSGMYL